MKCVSKLWNKKKVRGTFFIVCWPGGSGIHAQVFNTNSHHWSVSELHGFGLCLYKGRTVLPLYWGTEEAWAQVRSALSLSHGMTSPKDIVKLYNILLKLVAVAIGRRRDKGKGFVMMQERYENSKYLWVQVFSLKNGDENRTFHIVLLWEMRVTLKNLAHCLIKCPCPICLST